MWRLVCLVCLFAPLACAFVPGRPSNCERPPVENNVPQSNLVADASMLLSKYDAGHCDALRRGKLDGGGVSLANEFVASEHHRLEDLAGAVRTLVNSAAAMGSSLQLQLGVCAPDAGMAVVTLQAWVGALDLPRGLLYGADTDGVALDLRQFGASYIKYNANSEQGQGAGAAQLSKQSKGGASMSLRGVYIAIGQGDRFKQYGALPLELFGSIVDQRHDRAANTPRSLAHGPTRTHRSRPAPAHQA